jgi:glucose-6-phosphate isomerase
MDTLLLRHPRFGWMLDATLMAVSERALDRLPWATAFSEMEALERGEPVNRDEGRMVGHYWLRDPMRAPTMGLAKSIGASVEAVSEFVDEVRTGKRCTDDGSRFASVVHVGIGGSALGPRFVVDALGDGGLPIRFLDNTDPDGIARTLRGLDLSTVLVVVVTKSGGTPETRNAMLMVREAMVEAGVDFASRAVAITVADSKLDQLATKENWAASFHIWDWVGGRMSVTGAVGLLPAGLSGIDVRNFLAGAAEMDGWTRSANWRDNPAAVIAGCWHIAGGGRGDRNLVMIPYSDRLRLMASWLQQLVMESVGKRHDRNGKQVNQGLTVFGNKGSTDQHAYVQQLRDGRNDFFVTLVQVLGGEGSVTEVEPGVDCGDYLQGFLLGTRRALADDERPTMTITVPHVSAHSLGALIALFERAVGFYGSLIDVNAYHQPGVEAGKQAAKDVLALRAKLTAAVGTAPRRLHELSEELSADRIELLYMAERMVETGRFQRAGDDGYVAG